MSAPGFSSRALRSALLAGCLYAQQDHPQTAPAKLSFDVASVKERAPQTPPSGAVGVAVTPGRLTANCASVMTLVFYAYRLTRATKIVGGPDWMRAPCGIDQTGTFMIDARMDPATTDAQAREMMQTLLAERFKVSVHWETKQGPVYELIIAAGGAKIRPADPARDTKPLPRGSIGCPSDDLHCHIIAGGPSSIGSLANMLSISAGRPVIDKTGLTGEYETDLKWAGDDSVSSSLPSLGAALKESFGLELRPEIGPVRSLLIDHVEKPAAN